VRVKHEREFQNILDVFSGADGGVKFVLFRQAMQVIDEQAENGDDASQKIMLIMTHFSNLIDVTTERT
jgi:hypothetical protein